ncbi:MAG: glycosyltransferase family 4 protein [Actinomycetota bacterium]|nr:glycosyltransferase family 4 protein [Actinomycetota bacterium]
MIVNAIMPDQLGGLQRYVRELAGAIVARGVPVTVLAKRVMPETPRYERADDGVELRRFDVPERSHPLYAAAYPLASLRAVARSISATDGTVHVHYPLQGAPAALLGVPYLHTFHAPIHRELLPEHRDRYALPGALRGSLVAVARAGERLVATRARATIVLTSYMRGQLADLSPAAAHRAQTIPSGIDGEHFSPGPGIDHPVAREGAPLLFTARRLVPRTGVSELVRAMPEIVAELPGARLAVAGDGPLAEEIRSLIRELSLAGSVFLLGRVSEADLVGWYRAANLFVLPTQELEGFGISTIEALACGTPVVGTPVGGTPEILAAIDPRLLAAGPSPSELAAAVLGVTRPEGVLGALASRVRARVIPAMSWPTIADRHLEVYERMARG